MNFSTSFEAGLVANYLFLCFVLGCFVGGGDLFGFKRGPSAVHLNLAHNNSAGCN